jgi:putative aminopeptidase FrvX
MLVKLKDQLIELLNIYGISNNEAPVRDYLMPILENLMDTATVDDYGNLIGVRKCGTGAGATVLLSAHMDTVRGVRADKKVIERDGIFSATLPDGKRGILGADDRAGIAIILNVLEHIPESFNGVIKVAFSREEEIGCIGASNMDKSFYKDVNLAIVVDRNGNRDIVVGCSNAFCSDAVGDFMEEVSQVAGMDYKCVEGGISDAVVFSENGVNSINLSAGYFYEHTEREFVSIFNMEDTSTLILQAISLINGFYKQFGKVPVTNRWVDFRSYKYVHSTDVWISEEEVYSYIADKEIVITQGVNEIILSKEALKEIYLKSIESLDKRQII